MFVGYGVIVLLTSLGFNGVLGGRPLYGDSPLLLAAGMLVAVIAGLVGGYTAGLIGPGRAVLNASLVLVPLVGDTIYVWRYNLCLVLFQAKYRPVLVRCSRRGDSHGLYPRGWTLKGTKWRTWENWGLGNQEPLNAEGILTAERFRCASRRKAGRWANIASKFTSAPT